MLPNTFMMLQSVTQRLYNRGTHGAGHFVKMVHDGIEYDIMAAYADDCSR
jgi:6-phosphogluconate dehydrogenase (decarboxylating)